MKQLLLLILFTFAMSTSNAQDETLKLDDFNKLSVSSNIKMELIQSSENKMEIEITKGKRSELKIEERSNNLKVYIKGKNSWGNTKTKANIKLYFKELSDISVAASARVFTDDIIKADDFEADVSSSGRLSINLEANSLESDVSSSGSFKVEGIAKDIDVSASSSGSFQGGDLKSETADLKASSSGSIKTWVTKSIKASSSSAGSIRYKGNPPVQDIDRDKWSGGSISSANN